MGCDGGTIPRRDELVRLKKKPEQKDKDAELQFRWRHCALNQQPLQEPIVMCGLGRLYSKQNVIENLLEKEKMPESASHIKSLKDVKNLNMSPNPAYSDHADDGGFDVRSAPYICKLIGLEMTGKFRFVALWSCGCVFSERALKEIKSKDCSLCHVPFTEQDVVILNGRDEEVDLMRVKMEARKARLKAAKKDKKSKVATCTVTTTETVTNNTISNEPETDKIVLKTEFNTSSSSKILIKTEDVGGTSKFTKLTKILKRNGQNEKLQDPAFKKSKDSYSVADDPTSTEVYKSLFTTHKDEQEQTRAHWITYNPFYN